MSNTTITRQIDAPAGKVFSTVADIEVYSTAIPHITEVKFLSDRRAGVGTRFRETRRIKGREATTELEVTEYVENERVRLVSDSGGTLWDTTFTTVKVNDGTLLTMSMEAKPHTLLAKLTTPLMKGMIRKEIEKDMDLVKQFCERPSAA